MLLDNYLKPTSTFFRFLLVGVVNTMVGLSSIFILMNGLGLSYWLSTFLGNSAGATISFLLNRSYTFKSDIGLSKGAPRFVFIILISYFVSYSLSHQTVYFLGEIFYFSENNLAVLIGTVLYTVINYTGQKLIVFPNPQKDLP